MHLDLLLADLKALYGNPQHAVQTDYRWEIRPPNGMTAVHLCVNLEHTRREASIWIFDPRQGDQSATRLRVKNHVEILDALETIKQRLAHH